MSEDTSSNYANVPWVFSLIVPWAFSPMSLVFSYTLTSSGRLCLGFGAVITDDTSWMTYNIKAWALLVSRNQDLEVKVSARLSFSWRFLGGFFFYW